MVDAGDGGGATTSTFLFGDQMDVTSGGVTKTATRPGFTITVTAPNVPPSDPVIATPDQLSGALSSLEGTSEPEGEGENAPTRRRVAASGLSQQGSNNQPAAMRARAGVAQARTQARGQSTVSGKAEGAAEKNQMSQKVAIDNSGGGATTDVFSQENVITTEQGQAQMLFLDESALDDRPQFGSRARRVRL